MPFAVQRRDFLSWILLSCLRTNLVEETDVRGREDPFDMLELVARVAEVLCIVDEAQATVARSLVDVSNVHTIDAQWDGAHAGR